MLQPEDQNHVRMVLTFFTGLIGLIIYLLVRPKPISAGSVGITQGQEQEMAGCGNLQLDRRICFGVIIFVWWVRCRFVSSTPKAIAASLYATGVHVLWPPTGRAQMVLADFGPLVRIFYPNG
jgi:hypothetical protein